MRLPACFHTEDDYSSRDNREDRGANRNVGFIPESKSGASAAALPHCFPGIDGIDGKT